MKRYILLLLLLLFIPFCLSLQAQVNYIIDSQVYSTEKSNILFLAIDNGGEQVVYIIQKSDDGIEYTDFRYIKPLLDGSIKHFIMEDVFPNKDTYYRVYEITPDNSTECEPVKVINDYMDYRVPESNTEISINRKIERA